MKPLRIGSRGLLFAFQDPFLTNVYVIIGQERVYVIDTFLGMDSMKVVEQTLMDEGYSNLPVIVFNSHGDYDHYWGNAAFDDALVLGHRECRDRILAESEEALRVNSEQKKGEVIIKAPSQVFSSRISFPNDGITFFHTPGHTTDSSSCIDETDKMLFVGDNVETPLPYVYNTNIAQFSQTLKDYLEIDWDVMIASHAPPLYDKKLLYRNIEYLEGLKEWNLEISALTEDELHLHIHNISYLRQNLSMNDLSSAAKQHFKEMEKLNHL
ncbi:MAG: MBL fold metallo-hydrolase [Candidatus Thorarchaeota archaeon]